MDALTRFLTLIGRELGRGLQEVSTREFEIGRQEEARRRDVGFQIAAKLAEQALALKTTPGFTALSPEERANYEKLVSGLVAGQIDPTALDAVYQYNAKVANINNAASAALQAIGRGDHDTAARIIAPLAEANPQLVDALGLRELWPSLQEAYKRVKREEFFRDAKQIVELAFNAPDLASKLKEIDPSLGDAIDSMASYALRLREIGVTKEEQNLLSQRLNEAIKAGVTDSARLEEYLAKDLPEGRREAAKLLAQFAAPVIGRATAAQQLQLGGAAVELAKEAGLTGEEAIASLLRTYGMPEDQVVAMAKSIAQENQDRELQRTLQLKGIKVQLDAAQRQALNDTASALAEALANSGGELPDEMLRSMAMAQMPGADEKLIDVAIEVARNRFIDLQNKRADLEIQTAIRETQAYEPTIIAAVKSRLSEEAFLKALPPTLSPRARDMLLAKYRAAIALADAGAQDELLELAAQLPPPTTPEAMDGTIALLRQRAQSLGLSEEQFRPMEEAFRKMWAPRIEEYRFKQSETLINMGKALGAIGAPEESLRKLASDPDSLAVLQSAYKAGQTDRRATDLEKAFNAAAALAKAGYKAEDAKRLLTQTFDPYIVDAVMAGYGTWAAIAHYDIIATLTEAASKLATAASPEDRSKLLRQYYDFLANNYGKAVANGARNVLENLAKDAQKLKELDERERRAKIADIEAQIKQREVQAQATRENIKQDWERIKQGWKRLDLDGQELDLRRWQLQLRQEEFEFNKALKLLQLQSEASGDLKKELDSLKTLVDVSLKVIQENVPCVGGNSLIDYIIGGTVSTSPDCQKAVQEFINSNPEMQKLQELRKAQIDRIMAGMGLLSPGGQSDGGAPGDTTKPSTMPEVSPTRPMPSAPRPTSNTLPPPSQRGTLGNRIVVTPESVSNAQKAVNAEFKDMGIALGLMATEHVPGYSDRNPLQVMPILLKDFADRCKSGNQDACRAHKALSEGCRGLSDPFAVATCQAKALRSYYGEFVHNLAHIGGKHFLPAAAAKPDKTFAELGLKQEYLDKNPAIARFIKEVKGKADTQTATGRDVMAFYAYRAIAEYADIVLDAPKIERTGEYILPGLARAARSGNENAKTWLYLISYATAFAPSNLAQTIDRKAALSHLQQAAQKLGVSLPDNKGNDRTLDRLIEAYRESIWITNVNNLGGLVNQKFAGGKR